MMNNWLSVWQRRQQNPQATDLLQQLIDLDGFDCGAGRIEAPAWRDYVARMAGLLGLQRGDSVFEVGCGAGAFLYALHEQGVRVAGLDYAHNLVLAARQAMPGAEFHHAEASAIAQQPDYDFVIANSVFHYFAEESYAETVLDGMLAHARRGVAVLEVPDLASRDEAERMRRDILTPAQYEEKYQGLSHCYYDRHWFVQQAAGHGFDCRVIDQTIDGYAQSRFRFNCLLTRTSTPA